MHHPFFMQRTRKSPAPRSRFPRPGAGPAGPPEYICRSRFRYSHLVEKRFQQGKTVIFDTKQRFLLFLALIIARFLQNASIFSHIFGYISVSLVQNVQESVPLRLTVLNPKTFVLDTRIFGVSATSGPRRSEISVFLFLVLALRSRSAQKRKKPRVFSGFFRQRQDFPRPFRRSFRAGGRAAPRGAASKICTHW